MPEKALEILFRTAMLPVLWCVVVQAASAQMATITGLNVVSGNNQVRVEVSVNAAVTPRIATSHEERQIELEFANTVAELPVRLFSINSNGVERVWVTVDRTHGMSKITIDLFRKGQISYSREGAKVVVSIIPRSADSEVAGSKKPSTSPSGAPAAASGPWISLSRQQKEPALPPSTSAGAISAGQGRGAEQQIHPSTASPPSSATSSSTFNNATPKSVTVSIGNRPLPPQSNTSPVAANSTTGSSTTPGFPSAVPTSNAKPGTQATNPGSVPSAAQAAETAPVISAANNAPAATSPSSSTNGANPSARSDTQLAPPANIIANNPAAANVASPNVTTAKTENANAEPPVESTETTDTTSAGDQPSVSAQAGNLDLRTAFRVKYVADGAAYLDGGSTSGLAEGLKLVIRDPATTSSKPGDSKEPVIVAQLDVVSVAQSSAVTEIHSPTREIKPGDLAYLTSEDAQALVQQRALSSTRLYPQVITFTEGDPADEEAREYVPRPPLPEVNRARGRIGFEYSSIMSQGSVGSSSSELGLVLRSDITRIGGSYWNLSGYWRGRLESQGSSSQQTLQDLINRTYHLSLTYDNPKSAWVAGVGRMFLPWASSLDTIDGGYVGRKISKGVTAGMFAGSTPDPTSWSYNPNQRLAGTFVNFEGGSFDALRYTSTAGFGVSMLHWNVDRPFVFFENGIFYKRIFSVYDSLQIDHPSPTPNVVTPGTGISRSYLTVRVQPIERLSLDFNHNYFRDVPTFDLALVGTGLLDKVLFQGFSVGARVEVLKKIYLYTDQGLSNRSGDTKNSLNQMYGISWADMLHSGVRADLRYSKFNSSFAQGSYEAVALSRNFRENFRWEVQVGKQAFVSPLTTDTGSRFVNFSLDSDFGAHYFVMSGVTINRGAIQNYQQWYVTLGYRFDNRWKTTTK